MLKRFVFVTLVGASFLAGCATSSTGAVGQKTTETGDVFAESRGGLQQAALLLAKETIKKLDSSGDGFVTLEEWEAAKLTKDEFKQLDQSHEGRLSISDLLRAKGVRDFKKKTQEVAKQFVAKFDANKDGLLSRAEFAPAYGDQLALPTKILAMTAFDLADRNLDGQLLSSELENLVAFSVVESILNASTPPTNPGGGENPPGSPSKPGNPGGEKPGSNPGSSTL